MEKSNADSRKSIELWEYSHHGAKSYYDPNHRIIFGPAGLAVYQSEFGERLKIVERIIDQDKPILRESTNLLSRESDISRELNNRFQKLRGEQ